MVTTKVKQYQTTAYMTSGFVGTIGSLMQVPLIDEPRVCQALD
jgi:hypothetical protein